MNRIVENREIRSTREDDISFNNSTTMNKKTKLLIVGTITPPNDYIERQGRTRYYYYCSKRNSIYRYIDNSLDLNSKLINANEDCDLNRVKSILNENKIAFFDVMEKVDRIHRTAKDSDIIRYSLDKNSKLKSLNKDVTIMCNSKLAYNCFKVIVEEMNIRNISENKIIYLSQYGRWSKDNNKGLSREEKWNEEIKKCF